MKWIETIEIRSLPDMKDILESELKIFMEKLYEESGEQSIRIFNKLYLDTDYVILLINNSSKVTQRGSQLGQRLASALKEFGMINQNIWSEI